MTPAPRSVYHHYQSLVHSSPSVRNTDQEVAAAFTFNYFLSKPAASVARDPLWNSPSISSQWTQRKRLHRFSHSCADMSPWPTHAFNFEQKIKTMCKRKKKKEKKNTSRLITRYNSSACASQTLSNSRWRTLRQTNWFPSSLARGLKSKECNQLQC